MEKYVVINGKKCYKCYMTVKLFTAVVIRSLVTVNGNLKVKYYHLFSNTIRQDYYCHHLEILLLLGLL